MADALLIPGVGLVESGSDALLLPGGVVVYALPAITATIAATESGSDTLAATAQIIVSVSVGATESGSDTLAITLTVEADEVPPSVGGGYRAPDQVLVPIVVQRWIFDDRDLLEMVPIIVSVINAARH